MMARPSDLDIQMAADELEVRGAPQDVVDWLRSGCMVEPGDKILVKSLVAGYSAEAYTVQDALLDAILRGYIRVKREDSEPSPLWYMLVEGFPIQGFEPPEPNETKTVKFDCTRSGVAMAFHVFDENGELRSVGSLHHAYEEGDTLDIRFTWRDGV